MHRSLSRKPDQKGQRRQSLYPSGQIRFFLGADVGGRGASMIVSEKPDISTWTVEKPDGTQITIQVNKKDANKY